MPPKKELENTVTQGKSNKNCYWINMKAYQMLPNNEIVFAAGGIRTEVEMELVKAFIKRNKKVFNVYENLAVKEYNEIVDFGKHKGLSVSAIFDIEKSWLKWCRDNFKFNSAQEKLKKQIIEILK